MTTQQCSDAASYQDSLLPPEFRNKGLIRHYHGGMSKAYLKEVFDDSQRMTVSAGYYMELKAFLQYMFNLAANVPALRKDRD
jgi:hypothetical protein